jgi:outer membrane protein
MPFAVLAGTLGLLIATPAEAQIKIGVFDAQRVSEETVAGKRVQAELEAKRDQKQQQITTLEQEVGALQGQLQQQALSLSIDRRTQMEIDIQRKMLTLQSVKDMATRELQLEVAAAEAVFNEQLRLVIDQVGRDGGFSMILDRTAVAWASAGVDLTVQIIAAFDAANPSAAGQ